MNNAFFVSFFNHALPDIQSQASVAWRLSQLAGEIGPRHNVLAITVAKRKAKTGIAEWA